MDTGPSWGRLSLDSWFLLGAVVFVLLVLAFFALKYSGPRAWLLKVNLLIAVAFACPIVFVSLWALSTDSSSAEIMLGLALIELAARHRWPVFALVLLPGLSTIAAKDMSFRAKITNLCISVTSCALEGRYMYIQSRPQHW